MCSDREMFEARHICLLACMHCWDPHFRFCYAFRYLATWHAGTHLLAGTHLAGTNLGLSFVYRRL